jgi:hypothetical protein
MKTPTFRKLTYRTPNRILADTGHKTFDRMTDCVMTGNVYSNVQVSSYIRPHSETECNGHTFKPGELRESDLAPFIRSGAPRQFLTKIRELTETESAILYKFRHYVGRREIVHGYALTRAGTHELIARLTTGATHKSSSVLDWCICYITPQTAA